MKIILRAVAAALTMGLMVAGTAVAQDRVDAKKDWSIFVSGEGAKKVCWIVSQPTKKVAKNPAGRVIPVQRSDIFLMVAVRKADGVKNEVSFLSGYPFQKGSKVSIVVATRGGKSTYTLFTDGENAWTASSADDDALTKAFRAGRTAVVTGKSGRGNTTIDTFSLSGFTAAIRSAAQRCN